VSRPPPQLEALTALLERENRIKEGAEKFLKLPITVRAARVSQRIALNCTPQGHYADASRVRTGDGHTRDRDAHKEDRTR
jgi:hypothetical protein